MNGWREEIPGMLRVRAGCRVLDRVREEGIRPERIAAVVGTATGPRWCAWAALDEVLARRNLSTARDGRVMLLGGSAGAWRMAALAGREPLRALARLRTAYIGMSFKEGETPTDRRRVLFETVGRFLEKEDLAHLCTPRAPDVRISVTRLQGIAASPRPALLKVGLLLGHILHRITPRFDRFFWERITFAAGRDTRDTHSNRSAGDATERPLTRKNAMAVLVASAAVPLAVAPVRRISGVPAGSYCDGGVAEYVWNRSFVPEDGRLVLLFHHGGPLYPCWSDKNAPFLRTRLADPGNLVTLSPGPRYRLLLPDGRLPDRRDWMRFRHCEGERIRRWNRAVQCSYRLGDLFERLLDGGAPGERVELLRGDESD